MPTLNRMTPAQLFRLVGSADSPSLIDVRTAEDVAADPYLIPAATRCPYDQIGRAVPLRAGDRAVVICARGLKLSEGAAAMLRHNGVSAEVLDGGMERWRAERLPCVPIHLIPANGLWVTRHRPKIDRIACAWLIRRFVDRSARFLFVTPSEVMGVADRFDATPFDVEGVFWTHRGAECSFDTMVQEFGLRSEAMDGLATVVRAADTDRHDLSPQAAGLLAVSVGLSRLFKDDLKQLEAGLTLYDALYRWARDGADEGHDWPAGRAQ